MEIDLTREKLALKRQARKLLDIGQNIKDRLAMLASTIVQYQQ